MLIRIGLGLMKHTQSLCRTLLADIVSPKDQLDAQGRLVSFASVGFIIGPAIGGHMMELSSGFYYVCLLAVLFFWINFIILHYFFTHTSHRSVNLVTDDGVEETKTSIEISRNKRPRSRNDMKTEATSNSAVIEQSTRSLYSEILQAITNLFEVDWSVYWDVFALRFLLAFAVTVHYQNFGALMQDMYNISPKLLGYVISLQGLVGATTGFTTEWINKFYKQDESNFLRTLHSFGILTMTFILMSIAPSLAFVITCLVPLSAAVSLLRITTSEIVLQRTTPNQRGSLIGSLQSMSSIARLLAPIFSGIAYDMFSFHGTAILKIASSASATALALFLFHHQQQLKKTS